MNLLWHQVRTDIRAQRWLLVAFISVTLASPILISLLNKIFSLSGEGGVVAMILFYGVSLLMAMILMAQNIFSSPFVGSTAFWQSRPISRGKLVWAKSLWIGGCILVPLATAIYLSMNDLSLTFSQEIKVFGVIMAMAIAALVVILPLCAASQSWRYFVVQIVVLGALMTVSAILFFTVVRWLEMNDRNIKFSEIEVRDFWVVLVAFFILLGSGSWLLIARWRKRKLGLLLVYMGVLAAPWITAISGFQVFKEKKLPLLTLASELIHADEAQLVENEDAYVIWKNIRIKGLNEKQVFVPDDARLWQKTDRGSIEEALRNTSYYDLDRQLGRVIPDELMQKKIGTFYPKGTHWEMSRHSRVESLIGKYMPAGAPRSLKLKGTVFEIDRLVTLGIHGKSQEPIFHGGNATVLGVDLAKGGVKVDVETIRPVALLRGEAPIVRGSGRREARNLIVGAVLYHAASGRAMIAELDSRNLGGADPIGLLERSQVSCSFILPQMEILLLGGNIEQWLSQAELHIYGLRSVGYYRSQPMKLTQDLYGTTASKPGVKSVDENILPTHFLSHDDLVDYLDTLIDEDPKSDHLLWKKFQALPKEALIELAKRLPAHAGVDASVFHILGRRISELPPELLLDGLKRDERFAHLCVKKNLGKQAAPILLEAIRSRRLFPRGSTSGVVKVVTQHYPLTPQLERDLTWRLVHAGPWERGEIAAALNQVEGFDFKTAIAKAWTMALAERGVNSSQRLAPFAVRLGDKEALRLTLVQLKKNQPKWIRAQQIELLDKSLETDLPPEEAVVWATENFSELQFNSKTGRFSMP